MNKKEEQDQSKPEMVIIDTLGDDDIEVLDKKTFVEIEKHLDDLSKSRNFDCLFMSKTKSSAKTMSNSLHKNHGYNIIKIYHDMGGWITNAVKQIRYPEIKDTLKIARLEAANHSSKLFDWMIEADK